MINYLLMYSLPHIIKNPLDIRNDLKEGGATAHHSTNLLLTIISLNLIIISFTGLSISTNILLIPLLSECIAILDGKSKTPFIDIVSLYYFKAPISHILNVLNLELLFKDNSFYLKLLSVLAYTKKKYKALSSYTQTTAFYKYLLSPLKKFILHLNNIFQENISQFVMLFLCITSLYSFSLEASFLSALPVISCFLLMLNSAKLISNHYKENIFYPLSKIDQILFFLTAPNFISSFLFFLSSLNTLSVVFYNIAQKVLNNSLILLNSTRSFFMIVPVHLIYVPMFIIEEIIIYLAPLFSLIAYVAFSLIAYVAQPIKNIFNPLLALISNTIKQIFNIKSHIKNVIQLPGNVYKNIKAHKNLKSLFKSILKNIKSMTFKCYNLCRRALLTLIPIKVFNLIKTYLILTVHFLKDPLLFIQKSSKTETSRKININRIFELKDLKPSNFKATLNFMYETSSANNLKELKEITRFPVENFNKVIEKFKSISSEQMYEGKDITAEEYYINGVKEELSERKKTVNDNHLDTLAEKTDEKLANSSIRNTSYIFTLLNNILETLGSMPVVEVESKRQFVSLFTRLSIECQYCGPRIGDSVQKLFSELQEPNLTLSKKIKDAYKDLRKNMYQTFGNDLSNLDDRLNGMSTVMKKAVLASTKYQQMLHKTNDKINPLQFLIDTYSTKSEPIDFYKAYSGYLFDFKKMTCAGMTEMLLKENSQTKSSEEDAQKEKLNTQDFHKNDISNLCGYEFGILSPNELSQDMTSDIIDIAGIFTGMPIVYKNHLEENNLDVFFGCETTTADGNVIKEKGLIGDRYQNYENIEKDKDQMIELFLSITEFKSKDSKKIAQCRKLFAKTVDHYYNINRYSKEDAEQYFDKGDFNNDEVEFIKSADKIIPALLLTACNIIKPADDYNVFLPRKTSKSWYITRALELVYNLTKSLLKLSCKLALNIIHTHWVLLKEIAYIPVDLTLKSYSKYKKMSKINFNQSHKPISAQKLGKNSTWASFKRVLSSAANRIGFGPKTISFV